MLCVRVDQVKSINIVAENHRFQAISLFIILSRPINPHTTIMNPVKVNTKESIVNLVKEKR
jgi:hypothetical protein